MTVAGWYAVTLKLLLPRDTPRRSDVACALYINGTLIRVGGDVHTRQRCLRGAKHLHRLLRRRRLPAARLQPPSATGITIGGDAAGVTSYFEVAFSEPRDPELTE
jgi:hypothetical protein